MPIKSQAQRRFLHAKKPALAAEFEAATPPGAKLPERVTPKVPKATKLADAYRGGRRG